MAFWSLHKQPAEEPVAVATMDADTLKSELRNAYDRGRLKERSRRTGVGLVLLVLLVLAATGIAFIALAIQDGSFSAAGAQLDTLIAQLMEQFGR